MPTRVQLRRSKGWRLSAGTITVARPTRWGNPFRVGVHGDAVRCVARYRAWLLDAAPGAPTREQVRAALRGHDLACWCALDAPCHADVLLELANAETGLQDGCVVESG